MDCYDDPGFSAQAMKDAALALAAETMLTGENRRILVRLLERAYCEGWEDAVQNSESVEG